MTLAQLAEDYTRIARKLSELNVGNSHLPFPRGMMDAECAPGAAAMLCYLRDLFTVTPKEQFSREEILVLLHETCHDPEIFPCAIGASMWDMEHADE